VASYVRNSLAEKRVSCCRSWYSLRYRIWGLTYTVKPSPELDLPRATLHRLLAFRTGHKDFSWYHQKFHYNDAKLECSCGRPKTPEHLVHCKTVFRYLYNWPLKPKRPPRNEAEGSYYIRQLMKEPQKFLEYLQLPSFYAKVCTR
jgi:hypothetical protein